MANSTDLQAMAGSVAIIGSVTRDIIHRENKVVGQIGGTIWYSGLTLVNLGFTVRAVTRLAEMDEAIRAALDSAGIEAYLEPSPTTTIFHNIYGPGGRDDRRQAVGAVAPPITLASALPALRHVDLCYLGPLHPEDISQEVIAQVCGLANTKVALDVQGFTRRIAGDNVLPEVSDALAPIMRACHFIKASLAEASLVTNESDPSRAARRLGSMCPDGEILVTCGGDGVLLAHRNTLHRESTKKIEAIDPTGAGDMFLASYAAARLQGKEPLSAVAFGVGHAALSLQNPERIVTLAT